MLLNPVPGREDVMHGGGGGGVLFYARCGGGIGGEGKEGGYE